MNGYLTLFRAGEDGGMGPRLSHTNAVRYVYMYRLHWWPPWPSSLVFFLDLSEKLLCHFFLYRNWLFAEPTENHLMGLKKKCLFFIVSCLKDLSFLVPYRRSFGYCEYNIFPVVKAIGFDLELHRSIYLVILSGTACRIKLESRRCRE